jgi:hypothetical protein
MKFTQNGIAEKLYIQNRIKKLKTQAAALASIGVRYLGFHLKCSVRLFKAFLRPGLEYGPALSRSGAEIFNSHSLDTPPILRIFALRFIKI